MGKINTGKGFSQGGTNGCMKTMMSGIHAYNECKTIGNYTCYIVLKVSLFIELSMSESPVTVKLKFVVI